MRVRIGTIMIIALLCLAPSAAMCDLASYSQDFEGLLASEDDQPAQLALQSDGWKVFVNVFGDGFYYNYGPFPAPNGGFGGAAFSAVVTGQGDVAQGAKQLVVFSDYNNGNHAGPAGTVIESNVFQEQFIGAADVGDTWTFEFDAKRGNIEGNTIATAWFKTIGATFNYYPIDMTNIPDTWGRYSLSITITPDLVGAILQFGFLNAAQGYEGSGIYYDNVTFAGPLSVDLDLRPEGCPNPISARIRGDFPAALLGTADFDVNTIDVASLQLEGVAPVRFDYEDVAGPFAGDLCGCTEAGPDGYTDLTLKFDTIDLLEAIGYAQGGNVTLTLTGTLLDGTPIKGQDCVLKVGNGWGQTPTAEASGSSGIVGFQSNPNLGSEEELQPSSTQRTREGIVRKPTIRRSRSE